MKNISKMLVAACLTFMLVAPNLHVFAGEPVARNLSVFRVDGDDAFLARSLHGRGTVPREGQRLSLGNVMQTGLDTQVYMQLDAASIVKQDEMTYVAVAAMGSLLSLSLLRGSALVDVRDMEPGQSLETRIGSTVLAVRGTIFTAAIRDTGQAVITMLSGEGIVFVPDETGAVIGLPLRAGYVLWAFDLAADDMFDVRPIDLQAMSLFELQEAWERKEYLLEIGTITPEMLNALPEQLSIRETERSVQRNAHAMRPAAVIAASPQVVLPAVDGDWQRRFAMGYNYSAFIRDDGSLWTWGRNIHGTLGDGNFGNQTHRYYPVHVMNNVDFVYTGGFANTFAIRNDGSLWGWGDNAGWQLENEGGTGIRPNPIHLLDDVTYVATVYANVFVIRSDGSLWGWGDGRVLGVDAQWVNVSSPARIMDNVVSITTGRTMGAGTMVYVIRGDGSLWAWGWNNFGQVGSGSSEIDIRHPVRVKENVISVATCGNRAFAIQNDGSLWAWGNNWNGRLGDGTNVERHYPVFIMGNVSYVTTTGTHTLALTGDGSLFGWGDNWRGELGDGSNTCRFYPVRIMDNIVSVSASGNNFPRSFAVCVQGILWGWGVNSGGLGDGATTGSWHNNPVFILDYVAAVTTASTSGLHGDRTFALRSDGSLWAWGHSWNVGLGDGTAMDRPYPVRVIFP